MAIRDEIRAQRKKLKGKGVKAHLKWFWDYEKVPTLVAAGIAAVAAGLIVHLVTYKPYVFGVLFLNASWESNSQAAQVSSDLESSFMEYAGIDTDTSQILTDITEQMPLGGATSETDLAVQEKVIVEVSSNQVDAAVMDYAEFNYYLSNELFGDLRDTFDQETLNQYEGKIYYVDRSVLTAMESSEDEDGGTGALSGTGALNGTTETGEAGTSEPGENLSADSGVSADSGAAADDAAGDTAEGDSWDTYAQEQTQEAEKLEALSTFVLPDPGEMEDPVPVGIQVNDASWIKSNHLYDDTAAFYGVVSGTDHPETCRQFLEYLFEK